MAHGRVAPFIVDLAAWPAERDASTTLHRCRECDLVFYSLRFDDETLGAMYSAYRGDHYLRTRRRWEPWYSASFNSALEPGSAAVVERTAAMSELLRRHVDLDSLANMVDFGGDAGQFFPPDYAGPKYVIEVSGKELVPGVTAAASLDAVPGGPAFVAAAHLLEHVPDPLGLVTEIRRSLPADGWLYIELPLDRPRLRPWHARPGYARYLRRIGRFRALWILADVLSGVARNRGLRVPRLGAVKESEHINYFSEASLRRLLDDGGFEVVAMRADPDARLEGIRLGRLAALAKPAT